MAFLRVFKIAYLGNTFPKFYKGVIVRFSSDIQVSIKIHNQ